MISPSETVLTSFGPAKIKNMLGRPFILQQHKDAIIPQGFTLGDFDTPVRVNAQGHEIVLGRNQIVHTTSNYFVEAKDLQVGMEISLNIPLNPSWSGSGGNFVEGSILAAIITMSPEEAQEYLIDTCGRVLLQQEAQPLIDWYRGDRDLEQTSFEFYRGFLSEIVADRVEKVGSVYTVRTRVSPTLVLRMLLHAGIFATAGSDEGLINIPSYSLLKFYETMSLGSTGERFLPEVEGVIRPVNNLVTVDSVECVERMQPLYSANANTSNITMYSVNGFQLVMERF